MQLYIQIGLKYSYFYFIGQIEAEQGTTFGVSKYFVNLTSIFQQGKQKCLVPYLSVIDLSTPLEMQQTFKTSQNNDYPCHRPCASQSLPCMTQGHSYSHPADNYTTDSKATSSSNTLAQYVGLRLGLLQEHSYQCHKPKLYLHMPRSSRKNFFYILQTLYYRGYYRC